MRSIIRGAYFLKSVSLLCRKEFLRIEDGGGFLCASAQARRRFDAGAGNRPDSDRGAVPQPAELNHLHFNDAFLHLIKGSA